VLFLGGSTERASKSYGAQSQQTCRLCYVWVPGKLADVATAHAESAAPSFRQLFYVFSRKVV